MNHLPCPFFGFKASYSAIQVILIASPNKVRYIIVIFYKNLKLITNH